jgi:hypothetical protein
MTFGETHIHGLSLIYIHHSIVQGSKPYPFYSPGQVPAGINAAIQLFVQLLPWVSVFPNGRLSRRPPKSIRDHL